MADSKQDTGNYEERAALYYPYIHIRSENWLKSALLAFQRVNRIVPYLFTVADDDIIRPYSTLTGADGNPLLVEARIHTARVEDAQQYLFEHVKANETALVSRYSEERTPEQFRGGEHAFQMHRQKILNSEFSEWLVSKKLAWNTRAFEEQDTFQWLTLHPRLGAAIMSVLALAIAKQDGLNVVTPSRLAHQTLLANTHAHVLAKLLGTPVSPDDEEDVQPTVQELAHVVLITGFDLTRLKAEDIRDMIVKGGPDLRNFYGKLSSFAANIPSDLDEDQRRKRLQAKADEVLEDWRKCTDKLPQLKEAIKDAATEKGLEKAVDVAKDAVAAHSMIHFFGGIPGMALAVVVKVGSTMLKGKDDPYPFLNRVEKVVDKSIGSLYVPQWRKLAS
jgi:hypothetical protein